MIEILNCHSLIGAQSPNSTALHDPSVATGRLGSRTKLRACASRSKHPIIASVTIVALSKPAIARWYPTQATQCILDRICRRRKQDS